MFVGWGTVLLGVEVDLFSLVSSAVSSQATSPTVSAKAKKTTASFRIEIKSAAWHV